MCFLAFDILDRFLGLLRPKLRCSYTKTLQKYTYYYTGNCGDVFKLAGVGIIVPNPVFLFFEWRNTFKFYNPNCFYFIKTTIYIKSILKAIRIRG